MKSINHNQTNDKNKQNTNIKQIMNIHKRTKQYTNTIESKQHTQKRNKNKTNQKSRNINMRQTNTIRNTLK